jgi:hypothetical protein
MWPLAKAVHELKAANGDLVTRVGDEDDAVKAAGDA